MAHRHKMQRKASGGSIREDVKATAKSKSDAFKRGGKAKGGGDAMEGKGKNRLDRKHRASGGSALSTAAKASGRKDSSSSAGHESISVGGEGQE